MPNHSARSLLLGRHARVERLGWDRDGAELHGECDGVESLACAGPEERREFEQTIFGPQRHQPNQGKPSARGVLDLARAA